MERPEILSLNEAFLKKLTAIVFANLNNEQFGAEQLAREVGISRSQIHRKLHKINGKSITQFIREIRLEEAHRLLQKEVATASEIAYQVGFSSPSYFNKCFHEYYGYPPGEVKKKKEESPEIKKSLEPYVQVLVEKIDKMPSSWRLGQVNNKPTASLKNKLPYLFIIGFIIIISAILILYIPKERPLHELDKSIAVLPLKSLSIDPEKQYLADGIMDAITGHLSKISELRVIPRTSVEQFRGTLKTARIIGKELHVSYLIVGSFQMYDNKVRLTVQLVNAKEESHEWFKEYDREWKDIFVVQSDVAKDIANEIKVIITPEEQQIIEIIPTGNLTAYDFFMRARDEHHKFSARMNSNPSDTVAMAIWKKAITLYYTALEYDSTFAQAYAGLAEAYWDKFWWKDISYNIKEVTDSVFILINIALSYDDQCDEAYFLRGFYFGDIKNDFNKALNDLNKAIQINPNYSQAYFYRGVYNITLQGNYVEGIKNYHKAASVDHSWSQPEILKRLARAYWDIGFIDKANYYYQEAIKLDADTTRQYLDFLYLLEYNIGDLNIRLEKIKKGYADDSTNLRYVIDLVKIYNILGNTHEAYNYALKLFELDDSWELVDSNADQIGYAFWQAGKKEEAKHFFNIVIELNKRSISNNTFFALDKTAHYNLAKVYAFLEDKEKAYQYLEEFDKKNFFTAYEIDQIKNEPLFNSIREEKRFKIILQNMEDKYQKEHERVKALMEKERML